MGDTPTPAIATEALYKTVERFKKESPEAPELLKRSSYVNDLIDSKILEQILLGLDPSVQATHNKELVNR